MNRETFKSTVARIGASDEALQLALNVRPAAVMNWHTGHSVVPGAVALALRMLADMPLEQRRRYIFIPRQA